MAMDERTIQMNYKLESKDYAIGGKLLTASVQISKMEFDNCVANHDAKNHMRRMLVEQLVDAMLEKGLVEITTLKEPGSQESYWDEMHRVVARCYLAKDDQIKVLRTYG